MNTTSTPFSENNCNEMYLPKKNELRRTGNFEESTDKQKNKKEISTKKNGKIGTNKSKAEICFRQTK